MSHLSFRNELIRKGIHLCNSVIAFSLYVLDKADVLLIVGVVGFFVITFDCIRINNKAARDLYNSFFGRVTRDFESSKLTGASYVMLGSFVVLLFFDTKICIPALLIMSFSDTAAAIIGKAYGQTKIFNKSLEGSFAFLIVSLIIVVLFIPDIDLFYSIVAVIVVTIVELVPKYGLDDNLLIPIIAALIMSIGA